MFVPVLSEYVCYIRKLNITLNFMFRMYDNFFYKCDVTCSLPPSPCHKLLHHLGPPPPLERDVLYGRPLWEHACAICDHIREDGIASMSSVFSSCEPITL